MKNTFIRNGYSKDFKLEAGRLIVDESQNRRAVELNQGVGKDMIHSLVNEYNEDRKNAFPGKGHLKTSDEELHVLRRENEIFK